MKVKRWGFKLPLLMGILAISLVMSCGVALATPATTTPDGSLSSFTGNYYAFPIPHPDLYIDSGNHQPAYGIEQGLVNSTLTSANALGTVYLPTLTATGHQKINQFDWWSNKYFIFSRNDGNLSGIPGTSFFPLMGKTSERPVAEGTVVNNITGDECNVSGGYDGYTAVHWTATLTVTKAGTFGFNVDSDDDAWVFVNHKLVVDDGWIHDMGSGNASGTIMLQPGTYPVDIFYADVCTVQAGFAFSTTIPSSINGGSESFPILNAALSYFEQLGF